jgi:EAL domain-containing protein (putative c-di-GMP-specific phosphodiesterase class I)/GGDEF domain-containing protein
VDDKTHELLQMRAEWLKVRGYIYDPNTSLPAVPAVLEDVRRRIEKGERIGVIYVDVSGEEYLEEVYGWATYDGLLQQVAQALADCKGPLLGDDDVVALAGVRSDQFLVFVGLDDRRGARELAQLRERVVSELGRRIKIQVGKEVPRAIGLHAASSVLKYDPTVRIERSIYKVLDGIRIDCHRDREQSLGIRRRELSRILQSRDILIRYQPIVRLGDGSVFGYEALSCGPDGDVFQNPEMLFSFAEKTDQIVDLERLCRVESVRGSVRLPRGHKLFLNCSAHGIGDVEGLSTHLVAQAKAAGLQPSDVVLEITERVAVTAWNDFRKRIDDLRAMGFGVAIDDMGAGYSSLHSVAEVEPDFLKFDIALVRDIHLSPIKRGLLESLVLLAERIDSQVIAEGVEKEEEFETLREMNVPFGQGFLFSPPTTLAFHVPESP